MDSLNYLLDIILSSEIERHNWRSKIRVHLVSIIGVYVGIHMKIFNYLIDII